MGIGGWRLDVADELPDFFLEKVRESVKAVGPDKLVLGAASAVMHRGTSWVERQFITTPITWGG